MKRLFYTASFFVILSLMNNLEQCFYLARITTINNTKPSVFSML